MFKTKVKFGGIVLLCTGCVTQPAYHTSTDDTYHSKDTSAYHTNSQQNWRTHTVQPGDTLYKVARRFGRQVAEIAQLNNLQHPYTIYPGQVLRIDLLTQLPEVTDPVTRVHPAQKPTKAFYRESKPVTLPVNPTPSRQCYPPVQWQWPTHGHYERSRSQTGNVGVLIRGRIGQAIKAAAPGRVTYSGGGYGGYPNLITIAHNEAFLSVYAFNQKRWVQENADVTPKHTIAEMGTDASGQAILHFEIRCHGKALDPLSYLPR